MTRREIVFVCAVIGWIVACWFGAFAFTMGWGLDDLSGPSRRDTGHPRAAKVHLASTAATMSVARPANELEPVALRSALAP